MRFLFLVCVVTLVTAQQIQNFLDRFKDIFNNNDKYDYVVDYIHDYRFEDHDIQNGPHLLLAISDSPTDKSCHVVEIGFGWEKYMEDEALVHLMTEEVYNLISTHTGQETSLTLQQLALVYGDSDALRECFQHKVYLLSYTPSFFTTTTAPLTTAAPGRK